MSPQGHNIFCNLSSTEYSDLMQLLKQSILATDLTLYFEYAQSDSTLLFKLLDLHSWLGFLNSVITNSPSKHSRGFFWGNTAPLWTVCNLHSCVFMVRNRNSFFELVSNGEYNWNVKTHRDMCR